MNDITENIKIKTKSKSYEQVKSYLKTYATKRPAAITRARKTYYDAHLRTQTVYNQEARRQRNMLFTDRDNEYRDIKLVGCKKRYAFMVEAKRMRDICIDL
jgi:hypothetical protein